MRDLWRRHQLMLVLFAILAAMLAAGTWATYFEYEHNEQGFPEGHHAFWSWTFLAYWVMQFFMNTAPEIVGTMILIAGAAKLREVWEASG